jgi:hypothetical protein
MPDNEGLPRNSLMPPERSSDDLEEKMLHADRLGAFITMLPKWAALAVIAWQASLSVVALAGENAIPTLLQRFGRETSYWELVCWAAGMLGIIFGAYSHHVLRRQKSQVISSQRFLEARLAAITNAGPRIDKASENTDRFE